MKKSDSLAFERILKLRKELEEHNRRYYVENKPSISDFDYDILMNELITLEKRFPQFSSEVSPSVVVGSDIQGQNTGNQFVQVAHRFPMLSISNTYDKAELALFDERVRKALQHNVNYACELKIDGTAICLTYIDGRLIRAVTRGDGSNGDDVTRNILKINSIPKVLSGSGFPQEFEVRGEIFMPWKSFDELNLKREKNEEELFANPRNAASGSLKLLDSEEIAKRGLQAIFYHILYDQELDSTSHWQLLESARTWGLPTSPYITLCESIEQVYDFLDLWDVERTGLPYPTDGVVIKVDNLIDQKILGNTSKSPRWATAYKFKPEQALSRVISVDFQVGRTGAVTPVANLEPVLLSGTTVKRATLHNLDQIRALDLHINDMVYVEKGGEIIPKITAVDLSRRDNIIFPVVFPHNCPDCGTPLVREESEAKHYCPNQFGCPTQIKAKFIHFCGRKAMDILAGEATIDQLYEKGYISVLSDLYKLTEEQLLSLQGWKERAADRFLQSLEKSKNAPFSKVLFAIGIRFVGEITAKTLAKYFGNIDGIISATKEELLQVEEVGEKLADSVMAYFKEPSNLLLISDLKRLGINLEEKRSEVNLSEKLAGLNIVISGVFTISREEIKSMIEANSGKSVSSVASTTSYLLTGENPGPSKLQKAKQLGVPVISETEFMDMIR
ncbi:MAG: NAD-dependent DNA ligase LigA [Bacteroidia bacterium]|nr:NAD-dependent DNA ligase LigA [Bacteroidia bacterium]